MPPAPPVDSRIRIESMQPNRPDGPWYLATSEAEQTAILDRLARIGGGETGATLAEQLGAVSALIELCHVNQVSVLRLPVIHALGLCSGQVIAIPALHAELDSNASNVVTGALEALGNVGSAVAGPLILRWLARQKFDEMEGEMLYVAALALARTGHADAGTVAKRGWDAGILTEAQAHLVCAEAVSTEMLDQAPANLDSPDSVRAAALHLAVLRVENLDALLSPLLNGTDPELAIFAEQLVCGARLPPDEHVLQVLTRRLPTARAGRFARTLRAHPVSQVVDGFTTMAADLDPNGPDAETVVRAALSAGIRELQDLAVHLAACGSPRALTRALYRVHSPTAALRRWLDEWTQHADAGIVKAAIRARLTVFGRTELATLRWLAQSERVEQRLEWVRLQQTAFRDDVTEEGRTQLGHQQRTELARTLAHLIQHDPDASVRELSLYTAGNIGLTELADLVAREAAGQADWRIRRAAATALAEFPAAAQLVQLYDAAARETVEEVLFRLLRAILIVPPEDRPQPENLRQLLLAKLERSGPRCRVLMIDLLGDCGHPADRELLERELASDVMVRAQAAATALGRLGDEASVPALARATRAPTENLPVLALLSLGRIGGFAAAECMIAIANDPDAPSLTRDAAIFAMARVELTPAQAARLVPVDLDDVQTVALLELRLGAMERTGTAQKAGADLIDRRLAEAVPGFDAARLMVRHSDAVRALRTAEYFYVPGAALPEGLDSAPPVIFWVKGLELWLDGLLRPLVREFLRPAGQRAVAEIAQRWAGLRPVITPNWRDDLLGDGGDLFAKLGEDAAREVARGGGSNRVFGLRTLAFAILVMRVPGIPASWMGYRAAIGDGEVEFLANRMVALACYRNRFAHRQSGFGGDNERVREVALAVAEGILRIGGSSK